MENSSEIFMSYEDTLEMIYNEKQITKKEYKKMVNNRKLRQEWTLKCLLKENEMLREENKSLNEENENLVNEILKARSKFRLLPTLIMKEVDKLF